MPDDLIGYDLHFNISVVVTNVLSAEAHSSQKLISTEIIKPI